MPEGLSAADRRESRQSAADRRDAGRAHTPAPRTSPRANGCISPRPTAWHRGSLDESFRIWGQILDDAPTDLLAFRISDTIWFRHGQTQPILEQADRVAPRWSADLPGYDCAQTIWAFAHEEVGDTKAAERAIDAALERDPTNYFAHHVKAHIMDTDCRAREGSDWLGSQVPHWSLGNNLIHHLWWHRALLRLDLGEVDAVMASYDQDIRNFDDPMTKATPDHYVDLQNAAALLWRLEQIGLDVGDRWQELADKAEARIGEAGHLLMVPHLMLALVATGRDAAAARFVAALRELAADPSVWTAPAIADVVIPVCEAAQAHRRGDYARVVDLLAPRQGQDPTARRQQRAARHVLPDADRRRREGRPPRRGFGNDRARNRHPPGASDAARRLCRGRAVVAFLTLSGPPCSKPPPSGGTSCQERT